MRLRLFFVFAVILALIGISASACTTILGDFEVTNDVGGEGGVTSNKALGAACGAGTECASTFCADGVCCESACSGTCESCAVAEKGKCLPVPDGQDPKNQCAPPPREAGVSEPDAGPVVGDGGLEDAAVADAAASSGDDAGLTFEAPDSGLIPDENKCKGTCDGAKKCKFPDKKVSCGTQYCSSPTENTGLRCSGNGYCDIATSTCDGYACNLNPGGDGDCKRQCKTDDDCDAKHFCDGSVCKDKLPNGQQCNLPNQCRSGFCIIDGAGGVCCNSECDKIPGGNCKQAGSVGQCKCQQNCATGCRLFYKDGDGDKHGDENANTTVPGSTVVGCEGQVPPATYSDVKDDCNDQDIDVFPGQTKYFSRATNIKGGYDFNCDKKETKETDEYPGGSCRYCAPPVNLKCLSSSTICYRASQPATLTCKLTKEILSGNYNCDGSNTFVVRGGGLDKGFTTTIDCGKTGTYYDCGACTTKSTAGTRDGTQTPGYYQKCR
jgi:hypothetical protein